MLSSALYEYLRKERTPVPGVEGLHQIGASSGLETREALTFLRDLYERVRPRYQRVLRQRAIDREFIDQRTRACVELNRKLGIDYLDPRYDTVLGHVDGQGRTVVGPLRADYARPATAADRPVAPIPPHLRGNPVTLFGPPDDAKLSINAMNAYHRKLPGEPAIVGELLRAADADPRGARPMWGADDEDSKTPLRRDLVAAGVNLSGCLDGTIAYTDPRSKKQYSLAPDHLIQPIKRFPGLALPCTFLFASGPGYDEPMPLHLYDFALHLYAHAERPEALTFYVPKLENEEEAAYVHHFVSTAEEMIRERRHPGYAPGTVRLLIVLENPRAVFRAHEIVDALHPYFAGASLGWHDYLASTARLFKEDPHYRIPVKADPQIVIRNIQASHHLVRDIVGSRGGIRIGGMYGILSISADIQSDSYQQTFKGFIRDVVTQLKRGLDGFWVAHPDFIRIGIAMVEAWKRHSRGDSTALETLVKGLILPQHHQEILDFIRGPDIAGVPVDHPLYARSLLAADKKESEFISNSHPDEVRYNVFQSLQYLTDWLCGNGCVALPALVGGVSVRVMDDLATAERSRWEVWHEIRHGRFPVDEFIRIAHEELRFIRKDLSDGKKIVQVKWDERTARWYPIAMRLMLQLMTSEKPPEFATELLLPFTVDSIREAADPWAAATAADPGRYRLAHRVERLHELFEVCGSLKFARALADDLILDLDRAREVALGFDLQDILDAASFHGDIGEAKTTLDARAAREQAGVLAAPDATIQARLRELGAEYLRKFGFKYLISAQGRTAGELEADLSARLQNPRETELRRAREELWSISLKRLKSLADRTGTRTLERIEASRARHRVPGAQIAISTRESAAPQTLSLGVRDPHGGPVTPTTEFELASLSKTIGSAFAIAVLERAGIGLDAPVNSVLARIGSDFRLGSDDVRVRHLMNHQALNMHYVNGIPLDRPMPRARDLLNGHAEYGYVPIRVQHAPGTAFQYSGGGFIVLEHLIEGLAGKPVQQASREFFAALGTDRLTFEQKSRAGREYAEGTLDDGTPVPGGRLMFPAFAAGAMGTAGDYLRFLQTLGRAYHSPTGAGPIPHDAAVEMLWDKDRASQKFMGVNIGLGTFIADAGPNRLAVHQGANDGFRAMSLYCYAGPDRGKGFVIACNAHHGGVRFVAETAQALLTELGLQGVDTSRFADKCDTTGVPSEEIVNFVYKTLVFGAFEADRAEEITDKGPLDPLARYNVLCGARVLDCTNDRFARAENLCSDHLPKFDPELYGRQGKIMDSWESVRHNFRPAGDPRDTLTLELRRPSSFRYAQLSTAYHFGNQTPAVSLEARDATTGEWRALLTKTPIEGHAIRRIRLPEPAAIYDQVRVSMHPDGGFSRLGLYADLPADIAAAYRPEAEAPSEKIPDPIPHPVKPLTPKFAPTPESVLAQWEAARPGEEIDVACAAYGARIVRATNEHYSPATQMISPYPPLNMFDGAESARSRKPGHSEEVVIALGRPSVLHRIELDFAWFRNNNPHELAIDGVPEGAADEAWVPLVARNWVKPFAGNRRSYPVADARPFRRLRVTVYPDGGINRFHAYTKK